MSTDRIEKQIDLAAPVSRVWRALTDHREFGAWFQVALERPFEPGKSTEGQITYPGAEHMHLEAHVEVMEPETHFAFLWHPLDEKTHTTRVDFRLEPTTAGTRLRLVESGFDALPADRREKAFHRNEGGWTIQMQNIERHVSG